MLLLLTSWHFCVNVFFFCARLCQHRARTKRLPLATAFAAMAAWTSSGMAPPCAFAHPPLVAFSGVGE